MITQVLQCGQKVKVDFGRGKTYFGTLEGRASSCPYNPSYYLWVVREVKSRKRMTVDPKYIKGT